MQRKPSRFMVWALFVTLVLLTPLKLLAGFIQFCLNAGFDHIGVSFSLLTPFLSYGIMFAGIWLIAYFGIRSGGP